MNIFTAVGTVVNAVVDVVVKLATAAGTLADSADIVAGSIKDVATVTKLSTESMVVDSQLENEMSLEQSKARLADIREQLAVARATSKAKADALLAETGITETEVKAEVQGKTK